MPDPLRITEADLRGAMREPRDWQPHHPERDAFTTWVTKGWYSLMPRDASAKGSVRVRAPVREGPKVVAHWRGAPPGGPPKDGPDKDGAPGAGGDDLSPARWWRFLLRPRGPAGGRGSGGGGRLPRDRGRRWLDSAGKDRVQDLREAPDTTNGGITRGDIDQWFRPGGQAGRQRDLESLGPVGSPKAYENGVTVYPLPGGRQAIVRTDSELGMTMEIQVPEGGRFVSTDKFRYR